jgi:hypothetical protein
VPGEPWPEILARPEGGLQAAAEARRAALVVTGSRCGGMLDLPLGPRIVRHARRPLVIVPVGDEHASLH